MAHSHGYKIFEAKSLPELTAEQYNILLLAEADRVEAERKAYAHMKDKYEGSNQRRRRGRGQTISIKNRQ